MLSQKIGRSGVASLCAIAACAIVVALPAWAAAQAPQNDSRWQPWLGCWVPAAAQIAVAAEPAAQQVCVVPAAGVSAVDIVTVSGQEILSREHLEASGIRRESEHDGCKGWESAEWSADARRVYLRSETECTPGIKRQTTGLMTVAPNGDWLHVVGVGMRDTTGVRALRHQASAPLSTLPAEIASALPGRSSGSLSMRSVVALTPIEDAEIVDASKHVNAGVVQAWLAESRQQFTVNARRLVNLAGAGVDGRVTDMMIALAYPKAFSIKPSPTDLGALNVPEGRGGGGGGGGDLLGAGSMFGCGPYVSGFSAYGWDGCSLYGSLLYDTSYAYSRYGGLGYGGWYAADSPGVIIVRPAETSATHGRVVNGSGYAAGDSSGGSTASSGGGSSFYSGGGGGGDSGGGSSGGDRTAVPR